MGETRCDRQAEAAAVAAAAAAAAAAVVAAAVAGKSTAAGTIDTDCCSEWRVRPSTMEEAAAAATATATRRAS